MYWYDYYRNEKEEIIMGNEIIDCLFELIWEGIG